MNATKLLTVGAFGCLLSTAHAANVYVMTSGDPTTDAAVMAALTSRGHTATLGVSFSNFDGTQNLSGFQTVYLQANYNWTSAAMPAAGQNALVNWVNAGGRLVTCEWIVWLCGTQVVNYQPLAPIIPLAPTNLYGSAATATYTLVSTSAQVDAGIPATFSVPLDNTGGTETYTAARPGATTFFNTSNGTSAVALAGWGQGAGYVFSFSSTNGATQLADANFGRLFSNVMSASASGCYANCDNSTAQPILNANDFQCFLNQFAAETAYANCDNSSLPPTLNVNDFQCFLNRFAIGCN